MSELHATHYQEMLRRLRLAREAAGYKQEEVATILGRPQSFVSKMERGERHLDAIELQRLAELYGKTISDFIEVRNVTDPTKRVHEQLDFSDVMRSVGPREAKRRKPEED